MDYSVGSAAFQGKLRNSTRAAEISQYSPNSRNVKFSQIYRDFRTKASPGRYAKGKSRADKLGSSMGFLKTKLSPSKINSSQEDLETKIAEARQVNSDNQINRVKLIQTYRNLKRVAYPFVFMKPDQVHGEIVGKNTLYNDVMPDARPVFGFTRHQVNQAAHTARPIIPQPAKF